MTDLSSHYWNNRYITDDFGWDAGSVTEPLKHYIDQLHNKNLKILIPGAGNAYEADYLFEKEFEQVYVLDFAEEPLLNIKRRIPAINGKHLLQQNFFEHSGQYDLILEQTFFCALDPLLRKHYVKHMHELLVPKGRLAGVLFNDKLNTDKPPFGGFRDEYLALFTPLFEVVTLEPCYNSIKPRAGRELFMILQKK